MTVQVIRKTSSEWEEENPIIPDDMLGVEKTESGLYRIKRGNGVDAWLDLTYFVPGFLSMTACSEFVGDYCVEKGSYIPAAGRFAMFDPGGGLKSGRIPVDEDDVVRLREIESLGGDVSDNFTTLQGDIATVAVDLALEAADREAADTTLQENIDTEKGDREAADTTLQGNIDTEKGDREAADTTLQNTVSDIQLKIESLNGAYFVVPPFDFETTLDAAESDDILILNSYAISQTPGASGIADILDNTVIINLFDNCEYIYNKTSNEWLTYPNGLLAMAANNHLGVVKGTADPGDGSKDGAVSVNLHGEMEAIGFTGLKNRVSASETDISQVKDDVDSLKGTSGIAFATNDSPGIVKGSSDEGKIHVENDGTMSLNGYDSISIVDNLESTDIDKPLSANQGNVLNTQIEDLTASLKWEKIQNAYVPKISTYSIIDQNVYKSLLGYHIRVRGRCSSSISSGYVSQVFGPNTDVTITVPNVYFGTLVGSNNGEILGAFVMNATGTISIYPSKTVTADLPFAVNIFVPIV